MSVNAVHRGDGQEGIGVDGFDIAKEKVQVGLARDHHQHLGGRLGVPALAVQDGDAPVQVVGDGIGDFLIFLGQDEQLDALLGTGQVLVDDVAVHRHQDEAVDGARPAVRRGR